MTAAAIRIRPAAVEDAPAIARLSLACFGQSAWPAEQLLPSNVRSVWIADDGSARPCLGYAVLHLIGEEAELESLAVDENWRRQGIAHRLLEAALAEAARRGVSRVFLEVRESNLGAQTFYDAHGFRPCGRRPDYYHDPAEAAIVMARINAGRGGPAGSQ